MSNSLKRFARMTWALLKPPTLRESAMVKSILRQLFACAFSFETRMHTGSKSKAWIDEAPSFSAAMARIPVPVPASIARQPVGSSGTRSQRRRRQVAVVA